MTLSNDSPDLTTAMKIVRELIHYREQVHIEADGADDRVYPSDAEWESIEVVLNACEGEF